MLYSRILIELDIFDDKGFTVMDYAQQNNLVEVITMLEEYQSNGN